MIAEYNGGGKRRNVGVGRLTIDPSGESGEFATLVADDFQDVGLGHNDVTTLCDTSKQFIPGQNGSTATVEMILDSDGAANGQYDALHDMKATGPYPLTIAPVGTARNSQVILVNAIEVQLTTSSTVTGSVDASLSAQTDGATDFGVSLEALAAVTADTNGTSTDKSASSANGGVAHLHVTAFSGLTSDVITIEHSTKDSVWATLGTFATVTGLTSEHAKPSITLDIYGHLMPGMQEEAAQLMDELITPVLVQQLHPTAPDLHPIKSS